MKKLMTTPSISLVVGKDNRSLKKAPADARQGAKQRKSGVYTE
jgi:hypothetical protein